jgi:uncharacterized membrane protein YhaH (DUF805 family)
VSGPFFERLFGLRERVDRGTYFRVGVALMLLKYAVDAGAIALATARFWSPIDYLVPLVSVRAETVDAIPGWLTALLILWSLPFIWIGVGMTMRRAVDAGRSPWWCLAFFAPGVNYLVMLWLSLAASAPQVEWDSGSVPSSVVDRMRGAVTGVVAALVVALVAVLLSAFVLETYGLALFLATPFLIGVVSAYAYNYGFPRASGETHQVVWLSLLVIAGSLVLFALEGLLCIAMALPLGGLVAVFGGAIGREVAIRSRAGWQRAALSLLLLPGSAMVDAAAPSSLVTEVVTSIVVNAHPERVWDEVIAFRRIDETPGLIFRLGIAYPVRASMVGEGVGAIRRCEFSTGAFVEPITGWEAPHRLSFDVAEQPPVLQEWSPYRSVYAPHVDGFFRSVRGEFRLVPLPGGRTRLEGSTWYALDLYPRPYWEPIAEALLHRIHSRVLAQVKRQAEASRAPRDRPTR